MLINSLLKNKNIINSSKFNEEMINLAAACFKIPENFRYKIIRVNKSHVARPDLISQHHYQDSSYGDLICKLNGISNPFELNEGDLLLIPDYEFLDEFMIIDIYDDLAEDSRPNNYINTTETPTPKHKNQKRKPSEAVIGDTRFKIDTENRIIIY